MKNKISMNEFDNSIPTLSQAFQKFIQVKQITNVAEDTIRYYHDCYKKRC